MSDDTSGSETIAADPDLKHVRRWTTLVCEDGTRLSVTWNELTGPSGRTWRTTHEFKVLGEEHSTAAPETKGGSRG